MSLTVPKYHGAACQEVGHYQNCILILVSESVLNIVFITFSMICLHTVLYDIYYIVALFFCAGTDQAFHNQNLDCSANFTCWKFPVQKWITTSWGESRCLIKHKIWRNKSPLNHLTVCSSCGLWCGIMQLWHPFKTRWLFRKFHDV